MYCSRLSAFIHTELPSGSLTIVLDPFFVTTWLFSELSDLNGENTRKRDKQISNKHAVASQTRLLEERGLKLVAGVFGT
ncbi:hypothetical protein D3C80_1574300 [compost metagenome]